MCHLSPKGQAETPHPPPSAKLTEACAVVGHWGSHGELAGRLQGWPWTITPSLRGAAANGTEGGAGQREDPRDSDSLGAWPEAWLGV